MWLDLRFGLQQWRRNKVLAGVIILLLGVGIGANTLIYSFINSLLLKPIPVEHPNNLFLVEKNRKQQLRPDTEFYYSVYEDLETQKKLVTSIAAEQVWNDGSFLPMEAGGSVRVISTSIVSPNYFNSLGVRPFLGRMLEPWDANLSSDIAVVISYQFWRSEFNGDRDVIGRVLRLKNFPFRIVGVVPREFHSIDIERAPDVRFPISAARILHGQTVYATKPSAPVMFELLARLAPGIRPAGAAAAIGRVARAGDERMLRSYDVPDPNMRPMWDSYIRNFCAYRLALEPAARGVSRLRAQFSTALYVLLGAVGLLALAVAASVCGLLLARAEQRSTEIAIRVSMGASRFRVMRQFVVEHLLLALPVAALAIAFSAIAAPMLIRQLPAVRAIESAYATSEILEVHIGRTAAFCATALSLISLVSVALVSTWRVLGEEIHESLKSHRQGRTRGATGTVLVTVQVALGAVLTAGAVLMVKTFWNLEHLNPGFNQADLVEVHVDPRAAGYSNAQAHIFLAELQRRIATLPGVRLAATASREIMKGVGTKMTMAPAGVVLPGRTYMNTNTNAVSTGYFGTLGIPLLAGRNLEPGDDKKEPQPIVVNTAFVHLFFPHQDPVGKLMVAGANGLKEPDDIIVGVVGTAKYRSLREEDPPIAYSLETPGGAAVFYARTQGDPATAIGMIRGLVRQMNPSVPIVEATTMTAKVRSTLWEEKLLSVLAGFFGLVTLFLAATGVYGALDYSVAVRKRELGIRMAVGAEARDIVRTVSAWMILGVAGGLGLGIIAAQELLAAARPLLFGVQLLDPLVLSVTLGTILACAVAAAMVPVFRAVKTDPLSALRME